MSFSPQRGDYIKKRDGSFWYVACTNEGVRVPRSQTAVIPMTGLVLGLEPVGFWKSLKLRFTKRYWVWA
jgi:hypothetical protein